MKRFISTITTLLLIPSLVFIFIGLIVFFASTVSTLNKENPLNIVKFVRSDNNKVELQVSPTSTAQPDIKYSIEINNTLFVQEFTVSWTQLELNIKEVKTITHKLSVDEITAVQQHPKYTMQVYEIVHNHPILWLILPVIAFISLCVLYSKNQLKQATKPIDNVVFPDKTFEPKQPPELKYKKVQKILRQCLIAMDSTYKWYTNEDEANRELVSSLNTLGYKASYQYPLGNGVTADAFFCKSIIEGKLNPTKTDVDRLIGQISEYLKTNYDVHIVIYGRIYDEYQMSRIKEIVHKDHKRVFLTYLPSANRDRHPNGDI